MCRHTQMPRHDHAQPLCVSPAPTLPHPVPPDPTLCCSDVVPRCAARRAPRLGRRLRAATTARARFGPRSIPPRARPQHATATLPTPPQRPRRPSSALVLRRPPLCWLLLLRLLLLRLLLLRLLLRRLLFLLPLLLLDRPGQIRPPATVVAPVGSRWQRPFAFVGLVLHTARRAPDRRARGVAAGCSGSSVDYMYAVNGVTYSYGTEMRSSNGNGSADPVLPGVRSHPRQCCRPAACTPPAASQAPSQLQFVSTNTTFQP